MEAIEELVQLSDSMRQAAAVLADEDIDSYKRPTTFLNVVALGNVVSFSSIHISHIVSINIQCIRVDKICGMMR